MAIGISRSEVPDFVTQATSGAKSAMCVFSISSAAFDTNIGKYTFSTPDFLISPSKNALILSQIPNPTKQGKSDGILIKFKL